MARAMIHVPNAKYRRAKQLQDTLRKQGVFKPLYECYTEIDIQDKTASAFNNVHQGLKKAGFRL